VSQSQNGLPWDLMCGEKMVTNCRNKTLSPKYGILLTPLPGKNLIMHYSGSLYSVTLSPQM
jgi:hypothetical protein